MPTKRLAPRKLLPPDCGDQVECCRDQKEDRRRYQAGVTDNKAQPLYQTHNAVHGRAHVVGGESPHELVELRRSRTDP